MSGIDFRSRKKTRATIDLNVTSLVVMSRNRRSLALART